MKGQNDQSSPHAWHDVISGVSESHAQLIQKLYWRLRHKPERRVAVYPLSICSTDYGTTCNWLKCHIDSGRFCSSKTLPNNSYLTSLWAEENNDQMAPNLVSQIDTWAAQCVSKKQSPLWFHTNVGVSRAGLKWDWGSSSSKGICDDTLLAALFSAFNHAYLSYVRDMNRRNFCFTNVTRGTFV